MYNTFKSRKIHKKLSRDLTKYNSMLSRHHQVSSTLGVKPLPTLLKQKIFPWKEMAQRGQYLTYISGSKWKSYKGHCMYF